MSPKQELSQESRVALSTYRLRRAKEILLEADALIAGDFYNAAVNRTAFTTHVIML
jgi:hypothetical protein